MVASTSEQCRQVELAELQAGEGPCLDAMRVGQVVSVATVPEIEARWPVFAEAIGELGYQSTHAIPLRLRNKTIGSLNLFREGEGRLNESDAVAAQALADVATISILQERAISDGAILQGQLQRALDSRVLIEQAKGVLSTQYGINMDEAYRILRHHARSGQTKISAVAEAVIAGDLQVGLRQRPPAT